MMETKTLLIDLVAAAVYATMEYGMARRPLLDKGAATFIAAVAQDISKELVANPDSHLNGIFDDMCDQLIKPADTDIHSLMAKAIVGDSSMDVPVHPPIRVSSDGQFASIRDTDRSSGPTQMPRMQQFSLPTFGAPKVKSCDDVAKNLEATNPLFARVIKNIERDQAGLKLTMEDIIAARGSRFDPAGLDDLRKTAQTYEENVPVNENTDDDTRWEVAMKSQR